MAVAVAVAIDGDGDLWLWRSMAVVIDGGDEIAAGLVTANKASCCEGGHVLFLSPCHGLVQGISR